MIALLCAVQAEAELLLAKTAVKKSLMLGSKSIIEGTLAGHQVMLCIGGMGKVNAAHATTLLLSQFSPEALIIFGIGGAYPSSGAQVGDIAIAKEEIAGDEGVMTLNGFKDTEYMGIPLIRTAASLMYTTYPTNDTLLKQVLRSMVSYPEIGTAQVHVGSFVTLSTCTGTSARAQELEDRYHGLCENMEGAAAVQVAELHQTPWIEVRGISNIVEDRAVEKWDIPKAADAAQKAVLHLLDVFRK
jgi:futalosine hydrolase